jgi:hypothetical protein
MALREEDDLVVLISVQGEMEAEILRGVLESEGIRALIQPNISQGVYPITVDGLGKIDIYVYSEDLEKARIVLDEYRSRD